MAKKTKLVKWKLLSGSHPFPGPDGGTCINEAAIIARGFKYKEVSDACDCPPCFSRVIAQWAISINDAFDYGDDDERTRKLSPFVTRLAGTADKKDEQRRYEYLVLEMAKPKLTLDFVLESMHDFKDLNDLSEFVSSKWTHKKAIRVLNLAEGLNLPEKINSKNVVNAIGNLHYNFAGSINEQIKHLNKLINMGRHAKMADIVNINKRLQKYQDEAKNKNNPDLG